MSLYQGRGNISMQDEYMDFINYVFGFNGRDRDFYKLLPKLYKPEYDPAAQSYVAVEDGRIKAAVGAFDDELVIGSERFALRGIGNVAVHPFCRRRGYMNSLMDMAVREMIEDGVALSFLGGRRQRYGFFGYEQGCAVYSAAVDRDNFRYVYGGGAENRPVRLRLREEKVGEKDSYRLSYIKEKIDASYARCVRPVEKLYDILVSWRDSAYVFLDDWGRLRGYGVGSGGGLNELWLDDDSLTPDALYAHLSASGEYRVSLTLPPDKAAQRRAIHDLMNDISIENGKMLNIFAYERLLRACLKYSEEYRQLGDFDFVALIHGSGGDERLRIACSGGETSVEKTEKEADVELSALRAVSFFFGASSPERDGMDAAARGAFPLARGVHNCDGV